MITNESEFLAKIGKIVDQAQGKTMLLVKADGGMVYIEAVYFSYSDMQKFMHLLSRTPCEWYIYPATRIENGVQLKVRLF